VCVYNVGTSPTSWEEAAVEATGRSEVQVVVQALVAASVQTALAVRDLLVYCVIPLPVGALAGAHGVGAAV
jgi:flavin-binding protein dodecin